MDVNVCDRLMPLTVNIEVDGGIRIMAISAAQHCLHMVVDTCFNKYHHA